MDDDVINDYSLEDGEQLTMDNNSKNIVLRMHVANVFFRYIIGKRAQTKLNIESDTNTKLKIPRESTDSSVTTAIASSNDDLNFIKIIGRDKRSVLKTRKRIISLVDSFRAKQNITHFVAIPIGFFNNSNNLNSLHIRQRFIEFKNTILSDPSCSKLMGIDESVFHHPFRLHLTIRPLYLGDSYERKQAARLLKEFKTDFLDQMMMIEDNNDPILLRVKGLDIMNDDPSEAQVLYAKVEEIEQDQKDKKKRFKEIVNNLFERFKKTKIHSFVFIFFF